MATNTTTTKESLGRRISDSVLNLDYGDEQERMRYYEAYAIAVNVQMILLPLVAAIALLCYGMSATWPILTMLIAWFVPVALISGYLSRYRVRVNTIALSRRNRAFFLAYVLSLFALVMAIAIVNSSNPNINLGWKFVLAAVIGMLIGFAFHVRGAREERAES